MSSRSVARLGVLTALVAALGFVLAGVPNLELMSLAAFVCGALLGPAPGALVGGAAMAIYSSFNPFGVAPPPIFVAQVVGLAVIGSAGGIVSRRVRSERPRPLPGALAGGSIGLVLTVFYDLLTNFGTAVAMGALADPWPVMWGGLLFGVWHVVWNVIVFAVCAPALLAAMSRRQARAF